MSALACTQQLTIRAVEDRSTLADFAFRIWIIVSEAPTLESCQLCGPIPRLL
jgi:hypothetical protein